MLDFIEKVEAFKGLNDEQMTALQDCLRKRFQRETKNRDGDEPVIRDRYGRPGQIFGLIAETSTAEEKPMLPCGWKISWMVLPGSTYKYRLPLTAPAERA